MGYLQLLRM